MKKRTAVVTGGTRGIGRGICELLKEEGYDVVAGYAGNEEAAAKFSEETGIETHKWDVSDFNACQEAIEAISASHGNPTILVNNAGITRDMTFKRMTKADWDAVIRTNLDSVFNTTKQVLDGMVERKWGRIVNVSSLNGIKGAFGQTNYAAAKAGMHGFTKSLALEVARSGVTVNTISPGYIGTKMVLSIPREVLDSKILPQIPMNRLGKPEEIAGLIAYLCSEEAAFVTGANISINGGQHMF